MEHYDATLQGMVVPYETRYVETSFGFTHIVICGRGNGKPVVLWHGQNANVMSWLHWIPALAPTYRSYMIDVMGGMGFPAHNKNKDGQTPPGFRPQVSGTDPMRFQTERKDRKFHRFV